MATTRSDQISRCQQTTRKQSRSNNLRRHHTKAHLHDTGRKWWNTQALTNAFQNEKGSLTGLQSSAASGVSFHGGASFKVEKAHFGCMRKESQILQK